MDTFTDLLKYLLPSLVVFITAYYVLKMFLDQEYRKRLTDLRKEDRQITLPLRLQAYERLVLLLERISPPQMVMRVMQPKLPAHKFQALLLQTVREEFEHNLSQQIYISTQAWLQVKNAREEVSRIINMASAELDQEATATDLGKKILDDWSGLDRNPLQQTIEMLKEEARKVF